MKWLYNVYYFYSSSCYTGLGLEQAFRSIVGIKRTYIVRIIATILREHGDSEASDQAKVIFDELERRGLLRGTDDDFKVKPLPKPPYGPHVRYLHSWNLLLRKVASALAKEYRKGASTRELAEIHQLSQATVVTLLKLVETTMKSRGGNNKRAE
jgi:hypothetical protein